MKNFEKILENTNYDALCTTENKNADGNYCLTDADMSIRPEKRADDFGFAQMTVSEDGYNYIRQIHCTIENVSENHVEGHYLVAWTYDDGPCLAKWEMDSDFIYDGEVSEGFPHGEGVMKFVNGTSEELINYGLPEDFEEGWEYCGSFEFGIPHGQGKLTGKNGIRISGNFSNGLLTEGMVTQPTSIEDKMMTRKGTFYHGLLCGDACELETPRLHYSGQFSTSGSFHGKGRCEYIDGKIMDGLWEYGYFIRGLVRLADGSWYIGEWSDKVGWIDNQRKDWVGPLGYGTAYFPNGDVTTGYWEENKLVEGRIICADGSVEIKSRKSDLTDNNSSTGDDSSK